MNWVSMKWKKQNDLTISIFTLFDHWEMLINNGTEKPHENKSFTDISFVQLIFFVLMIDINSNFFYLTKMNVKNIWMKYLLHQTSPFLIFPQVILLMHMNREGARFHNFLLAEKNETYRVTIICHKNPNCFNDRIKCF